jgi:hypothetical protein
MTRIKPAAVCLFVFTITASGAASAGCPHAMPVQLLEDCIVYEGFGSRFPTGGYAYMERIQDWLKIQQLTAITPTNTARFVSD